MGEPHCFTASIYTLVNYGGVLSFEVAKSIAIAIPLGKIIIVTSADALAVSLIVMAASVKKLRNNKKQNEQVRSTL